MIIEFLSENYWVVGAVLLVILSLWAYYDNKKTPIFTDDVVDAYVRSSREDVERIERNARIELGTQTEEDIEKIRQQMDYAVLHSSGSSYGQQYFEYTGVSGTVYEFDPYKYPVTREHEIVRCKYCKGQNKATNRLCEGCGASL